MKKLTILSLLILNMSTLFSQEDGGHLCGGEDEVPIWILRFEIIDKETHYPVNYANLEIFVNRGDGIEWHANRNGVAVLVITNPNCLPYEGKLEITSRNYRYYSQIIQRSYFNSEDNKKRIFLEGHRHNWTDMNQIPSNQELIDKISAKKYRVGVSQVNVNGINFPNYAPACFEYEIELERITDNHIQSRQNTYHERDNYNSNISSGIPTINFNGEKIYVFPNDLSGGAYHVEQAKNACNSLNRLGYDDWYLPSKEELNILYTNKEKIGGFTNGWYWSSSSSGDGRRYWMQSFEDGIQGTEYKGTTYNIHKGNIKVRCIRKD